nr:MAG TPA: hypothetical protein [Caudoviricetes sp.]
MLSCLTVLIMPSRAFFLYLPPVIIVNTLQT